MARQRSLLCYCVRGCNVSWNGSAGRAGCPRACQPVLKQPSVTCCMRENAGVVGATQWLRCTGTSSQLFLVLYFISIHTRLVSLPCMPDQQCNFNQREPFGYLEDPHLEVRYICFGSFSLLGQCYSLSVHLLATSKRACVLTNLHSKILIAENDATAYLASNCNIPSLTHTDRATPFTAKRR